MIPAEAVEDAREDCEVVEAALDDYDRRHNPFASMLAAIRQLVSGQWP